jgi:hypothetical protein
MKVGLNTQNFISPAFKAATETSNNSVTQKPTEQNTVESSIQQSTSVVEKNNTSQSGLKSGIANVWKFFTVANQMANASLKGLFYGALTGVALLSGSWLFKSLPKAFAKDGPSFANIILHPLKNISKSGKIIAGVGSGAVLAYQLIAGKLNANQSTAVIDHKLKIGHRDK